MPYRLEFVIYKLPKPVNQMFRGGWQRRMGENRQWLKIMQIELLNKAPPKPLKKAKLTLVRASSVAPDYDGLTSSFKVILDCLIKCDIIIDDNMNVIGAPNYSWQRAPQKKGFIQVIVEELT